MNLSALIFPLLLMQGQSPESLSDRALEMAQQKRFAEAEKLWKQALAVSPDHFSSSFNLGFLYYSRGQFALAEPCLARAAKLEPKDFNARYILGAALQQLGRSDDALREWRAALKIRPDQVKLMQIMAVEYGKGRYFRESAAVAERALALKNDDSNIYLIAIKSYVDAADSPSALRIAEQMIQRFPDLPRANFEYGYQLHRAGKPAEAMPYLKKAMTGNQSYEEPFFFYGEILLKEGRAAEAIVPLSRAVELKRDYIAAWVTLARALMALGRYEEANAELDRAVKINPRHPQPHLLLSQLHFRLGREELAAREKEVSLKLRRENPEAMESPQGRPFPESR